MQAAVYGRAFCSADAFPRDRIVAVCRQLRILNTLRAPGVGLPLTAAQVGVRPTQAPAAPLGAFNAQRAWRTGCCVPLVDCSAGVVVARTLYVGDSAIYVTEH